MKGRIFSSQISNFLGKEVLVAGFAQSLRDHGKIIFLDLRDQSGTSQIVFQGELYQKAKKIVPESVIKVWGKVKERPKSKINPKILTGRYEIEAQALEILSLPKKIPVLPKDLASSKEEIRYRYRYLDLRREEIRKIFETRHQINNFLREFLTKKGFIEIETPILTKSTPEGARDFLVPSRLHPGKFYALPQSPQQYKQILMIGGIEKYFQIAKCFRDEDPRADRQPEFTQLDIEMSFVESEEEILALVEELILNLIKKFFPQKRITFLPFKRLDAVSAMKKYNTDKPDLRKNKNDKDELAFVFLLNFPMFEWKETEKRWDTVHHPFTLPKIKEKKELFEDPSKILAHQYDLVLNGYEIGGGSLRTTNTEILEAVFEVLGHKKKEIRRKFSHLIEAMECGVPPHGGIALGLDRLLAILLGKESIREVIIFPKTGDGRDFLMDLPSEVEEEKLKELHLKITKRKK